MPAKDKDSGKQPPELSPYYAIGSHPSQRWNPQYNVPRNSVDSTWLPSQPQDGRHTPSPTRRRGTGRSAAFVNSRRDADTRTTARAKRRSWYSVENDEDIEGFSDLALWLETIAELYMNNLDNRARWDPRWLNITRRERFEGLDSARITVLDYLADNSVKQSEPMSSKYHLANALHNRPADSEVRVLLVSDLSRFVMGLLGQLYSVDPDFWFEHLVNSGYAASDSGLKLKNAVWLNWAERETRLRHRALPGTGQRTEWNVPRRTRGRCWAHMHWGRLGLLNYLGRKGFYEDEIDQRLKDGRWVVERDVLLDKRGLLMTKRKKRQAERAQRKEEKKRKKNKQPMGNATAPADDGGFRKSKTSNVYRAYSTFEGMPKNPKYWTNRDLRVMAPEGVSYWSGNDGEGRKMGMLSQVSIFTIALKRLTHFVVIILVDPSRTIKDEKTGQIFPTVTFMPRALEIEAYTEEEAWRTAEPDETYLDPPPHPLSKEALKKEEQEKKKQRLKEKGHRLKERLATVEDGVDDEAKTVNTDDDGDSYSTDESDYDELYDKQLRAQYEDPRWYTRDRDFARKYALSTHDLLARYLSKVTATQLAQDSSVIPSMLLQTVLDDLWQLLAEMRLDLDHLDGDFGAGLLRQLVELYGNTILQNMNWMRSTLQELDEWVKHLGRPSAVVSYTPDLATELTELRQDLQDLAVRTDKTLTCLMSTMAIAQSTQVIEQTSGINKLTELAFVFVPISFITSAFSMQVWELTEMPPRLWVWGVSLASIVVVTYLIRMMLRSPSFRMFALKCRATVLSRYSSSKAATAAKQFNSVSNRAIVKFAFVVTWALSLALMILVLAGLFFVMVRVGVWAGLIATALYFIITRWPEPVVLIPCFISLVLTLVGARLVWFWGDEIDSWLERKCTEGLEMIVRFIPAKDEVEDDDLAMEGVETYARQTIMLVT